MSRMSEVGYPWNWIWPRAFLTVSLIALFFVVIVVALDAA